MHHPPSPDRPLAGLTVLAVEDSRFACEALRLLCQRLGARLRRAETLAAAAAHLRTYRPDVVLVDVGLPDGSGLALIASLAMQGPARPLVLGMSGEDGAKDQVLGAGAAGYMSKPIESLAGFRDTLLSCLPARGWMETMAAPPASPLPAPDTLALQDDLVRAAACLARDGDKARYVAGFITGLARAMHDPALERAAHGPPEALAPLIRARLEGLSASPPFRLS